MIENLEQSHQAGESEQNPIATLADLKRRKEELLRYQGTDAWVPEDSRLLNDINDQIDELESSAEQKKAA